MGSKPPILRGLKQLLVASIVHGLTRLTWVPEMSWPHVPHGVPGAHSIWRLSCDCPGWLTHMPSNLVLAVGWGHSKGCHLYGTTMGKLSSGREATTTGLSRRDKTSYHSGLRKHSASLLPYSFGQKRVTEPAQIPEEDGIQRCEHWKHGSRGGRVFEN